MGSYHDTVPEHPASIREFEAIAATQDSFILGLYRLDYSANWTPSEVQHQLSQDLGVSWPITSVRRAISNLTRDGLLRKTSERREGMYGRSERAWQAVLARPVQEALL